MLTLLCSLLCTNQPNILLIMVDDLGWRDTSVRNGPPEDLTQAQLHTPHIQRLADEGDITLDFLAAYTGVTKRNALARVLGENIVKVNVSVWQLP